jgi:hypothetical protein
MKVRDDPYASRFLIEHTFCSLSLEKTKLLKSMTLNREKNSKKSRMNDMNAARRSKRGKRQSVKSCSGESVVVAHRSQYVGSDNDLLVNELTASHNEVNIPARSHQEISSSGANKISVS